MSDPFQPAPEIIREFGDRSTLWLLEDPANLADLLRLLAPGVVDQLDFERAQRVNRSFVQPDLRKKESDLIYRVPVSADDSSDAWIYVLLEHQSLPDREMALRLLLYFAQLWDLERRGWDDRNVPAGARRLSPIIPLILYTGLPEWPQPLRLSNLLAGPSELHRFTPAWETLFLNVRGIDGETFAQVDTAIGAALRVLRAEQQPLERLRHELEQALRGLERLSEAQAGQWSRVAWFMLLLIFHRRTPAEYTDLQKTFWELLEHSRFRVKAEVSHMSLTMAEFIREQGREQGRELGRELGEVTGLRRSLVVMLTARFGAVPDALLAAIDAADSERLLAWTARAATAGSLSQVGIGPA
jgi:hypothetical protein